MAHKRPKKSEPYGVRFDTEEQRLLFAEACDKSGIAPPDALRLAAKALVACYNTNGRIPRDMRIVQDYLAITEDQKRLMHAVAELGAAYELSLPPAPDGTLKPGHKDKPPDKSQRHRGDGPRAKVS